MNKNVILRYVISGFHSTVLLSVQKQALNPMVIAYPAIRLLWNIQSSVLGRDNLSHKCTWALWIHRQSRHGTCSTRLNNALHTRLRAGRSPISRAGALFESIHPLFVNVASCLPIFLHVSPSLCFYSVHFMSYSKRQTYALRLPSAYGRPYIEELWRRRVGVVMGSNAYSKFAEGGGECYEKLSTSYCWGYILSGFSLG